MLLSSTITVFFKMNYYYLCSRSNGKKLITNIKEISNKQYLLDKIYDQKKIKIIYIL